MTLIEVDDLTFRYVGRKRPALQNVSFRVERGECLLVLGPSGCGKSTLALCLNGAIPQFLEGELGGRVLIDGLDTRQASMAQLAQRVGVVFQDPEAQFCMLTVEEEVAFGLENLAVPRHEMDARIDEALAWVGLVDRRHERLDRLSGGQKQRLALACVLAQRPDIIVFDEPTAQLDPAGAAEVIELLGMLRAGGRHTLVVVEHRLDDLMPIVDRTLVLSQHGEPAANGPPRHVLQRWSDWLRDAGVWIPQVSELATTLQSQGVVLDGFPLTVAEAEQALRPWLQPGPTEARALRPPGQILVDVDRLSFGYSAAPVLRDVSLALQSGQLTAIVGANGAGKSTLARLIVGILEPPAGRIRAYERSGYVFQYPEHQFVGRTVLEDVAYGLRQARVPDAEATARARAMLDEFGLAALAEAHPYSLSHGEQRRLSVAAMLVVGLVGLFLDEPTFGQDRRSSDALLDKLDALVDDGRAMIAITHDMRLVAERADRVIALIDGAIAFDGPPTALFSDRALLASASLRPPPVCELSARLGLPPVLRIEDMLQHVRVAVRSS